MKTQNERVLRRLRRGPLTAHQALKELGVARLAARVVDLKDQGHVIIAERIKVATRDGSAVVAQYHLTNECRA